ncbi:MAG: DUF4350 domain-containing protein [Methanosarcinales archaeon]
MLIFTSIASASYADYDISNTNWNGISEIYKYTKKLGYSTDTVDDFESALSQKDVVLIVLYPQSLNSRALKNFVENGGSLLLADDFGNGNEVLSDALLFPISFGKGQVCDMENNYKKSIAPIVRVKNHPFFSSNGVKTIVTNHPTYIFPPSSEDIAFFYPTSFIDSNLNGIKDQNEKSGEYSFARALNIGKGRVIVLSDPSIFINEMIDLGDNRLFYKNSINWLTFGKKYTIVFKYSFNNIEKHFDKAEKALDDAKSKYQSFDYESALESLNKVEQEIDKARDALYNNKEERVKSEINKQEKDLENLKKEIEEIGGDKAEEAKQYLDKAEKILEEAKSKYQNSDYESALVLNRFNKVELEIDKARDALYKNKKERVKIEINKQEKDLENLRQEKINKQKEKLKDILPEVLSALLKPLFLIEPYLLLFLALASLLIGSAYKPIIKSFFKKTETISEYKDSIEQAIITDNYYAPALYLGKEFKTILCNNINIGINSPNKDIVEKSTSIYPELNKRKLKSILKTIEKLETDPYYSISKKKMEKLYISIYNIGVRYSTGRLRLPNHSPSAKVDARFAR